jgi:hypothetical protein
VAGRQGGGKEIMSATVKQTNKKKTGLEECLLGCYQRRVTSPQRLKWPKK